MSDSLLSLSLAATRPLAAQVGGHAGVQTTEDESLLLKPALPREIDFYQRLAAADDQDELSKLRKWAPKFLGVLKLEGQLKDSNAVGNECDGSVEVVPVHGKIAPEDQDMSIRSTVSAFRLVLSDQAQRLVLENVAYGFVKPCILDVKLGTVLYDEDAPPEKQARMIKSAQNSTSGETGVRLTGFQVPAHGFDASIIAESSTGVQQRLSQTYFDAQVIREIDQEGAAS